MDKMDTVTNSYTEWRNSLNWGGDGDIIVSPNGYGPVNLRDDSFPFLRIALIRHYLNEYDDFPDPTQRVYESDYHSFER